MTHVESLEKLGMTSCLNSAASIQTVANTEQDVVMPSEMSCNHSPRVKMQAFCLLSSTILQTQERERGRKPEKRRVKKKRRREVYGTMPNVTNDPASESALP